MVTLTLGGLSVSYTVEAGSEAASAWQGKLFAAASQDGAVGALYQFQQTGGGWAITARQNGADVTGTLAVNGTAIAGSVTQTRASVTQSERDVLVSIENVQGTLQDDVIVGSEGANVIASGGGSDRVYGRGGNDLIYEGAGRSIFDGGAGSDTLVISSQHRGGILADLAAGVTAAVGAGAGQAQQLRFDPAGRTLAAGDIVKLDMGGITLAYQVKPGEEAPAVWSAKLLQLIANDPSAQQLLTVQADPARPGASLITSKYALENTTFGFEINDTAVAGVVSQVRASDSGAILDRLVSIENLRGSDDGDLVFGTGGSNQLVGEGGNDTIYGGSGNDYLIGGGGIDRIYGGRGVDLVDYSDESSAVLVDLANGFGGTVVLSTLNGSQTATVSAVKDQTNIFTLPAAFGNPNQGVFPEILNFEDGTDKIDLSVYGITSFSQLTLSTFRAQAGPSGLPGDIDANAVFITGFGAGKGIVVRDSGKGGVNFLDASDFIFAGQLPVGAGLERYRAYLDQLDGIESAIGTAGADTLRGSGEENFLSGGLGSDRLEGQDGNDFLTGGLGNDTIDGGRGDDTALFRDAAAGLTINLVTGSAQTTTVPVGGTGESNVLISVESVEAGDFDDAITGTVGVNNLRGHGGNDLIRGDAGDDRLAGDAGNDTLDGGLGTRPASGRRGQ